MRFLVTGILLVSLWSCSGSKMLQKSLEKYKAPIGYLLDSKTTDCLQKDTVFIRLNNNGLDSITTVSKMKGKVLPFIFFNYTESNMKVGLGQSSLEQSYHDFFTGSLIAESKRSGCFVADDRTPGSNQYSLEITIDTCKVRSKYQRNSTVIFLLFAYSMSFQELGFPSETDLVISTRFKKGEKVISEKSYQIKKTQPFLSTQSANVNKLRADFTANMVESLSMSTKQCIEELLNDINKLKQDN